MTPAKLEYRILGDFAEGGVARLRKVALADGSLAILRELQTSKLLNFNLRARFVAGARYRYVLTPHPNIVNAFEMGSHFLKPYELIEFVDGALLRSLMTLNDPHLKECAELVIREMAQALSWVHENHIMHLDVKPENFLVERTKNVFTVKLTDFDLARDSDDHGPRRQMGTPGYMAPEQFLDRTSFQASDVFAFGLIAYQLLTGRIPFSGNTPKQTWRNQASTAVKPRPIRELNPNVNPRLEYIIMGCLAKPLNERYRDMYTVIQALNHK